MKEPVSSILLAVLTIFFYSGFLFLDSGKLVFPFPLFPVLFLIVVIKLSLKNKEDMLLLTGALPLASIGLIGSDFFWSSFASFETYKDLKSTLFFEWLELFKLITLLQWSIRFAKQESTKHWKTSALILLCGALATPFLPYHGSFCILYLFSFMIGFRSNPTSISTYLFSFGLILESLALITTFL